VESWRGKPARDIGRDLDRACEIAGIERVTPHIFRHTAVLFQWAGSSRTP
jgi:integrase